MDRIADAAQNVTEDQVATLARIAGLALPPERLAPLTAELNGTLAIVGDLATVSLGDLATALTPFDPAWPARRDRRR